MENWGVSSTMNGGDGGRGCSGAGCAANVDIVAVAVDDGKDNH